jgi:hypothetical protein
MLLCGNPNAIHLVEKYPHKIHWNYWDELSANPSIFTGTIYKINYLF